MRIDVTNVNRGESSKSKLDSALKLYYSSLKLGHLLVVTANNKLLKFEARTGKILSEVSHLFIRALSN